MKTLKNYIDNFNNAEANFNLGLEYEILGQTGAAISFYLRTAEKATDSIKQYEALIRCALCFEKQGTRSGTVKSLYQKAIGILVDRPEAYFLLSRIYEANQEWHDCYTVSNLALQICRFDHKPLESNVNFYGKYCLIFQKGVAAWWVGLCDESREIMEDLKFNHSMNQMFSNAVDNNIRNLGYPNTISPYTSDMFKDIRYRFNGLEEIKQNFSQSYQDIFVLSVLNGKRTGSYLEIGSAEPFKNNNTALLETEFGWTGISLDINETVVDDFLETRKNPVFCANALEVDYHKLLIDHGYEGDLDYLQVDCDPPSVSFEILKKIPFDKHRFAVITFEHDYYADPKIREQSRKFLTSHGYELVVSDIAYNRVNSFEDWWVHPEMINPAIKRLMKDTSEKVKFCRKYMFPTKKQWP